jgi:hypothetical protein
MFVPHISSADHPVVVPVRIRRNDFASPSSSYHLYLFSKAPIGDDIYLQSNATLIQPIDILSIYGVVEIGSTLTKFFITSTRSC